MICVFRAETITLKSDAENTAEVRRLVPPVFVRLISWLIVFCAVLVRPLVIVSVRELVVLLVVLPLVPLLVLLVDDGPVVVVVVLFVSVGTVTSDVVVTGLPVMGSVVVTLWVVS